MLVVSERLHSADWREEVLSRYRVADHSMDAAIDAVFDAHARINAAIAAGEGPREGAYQRVSVYEADGSAVPLDWFDGPRDVRYGFGAEGSYGRLPARRDSAEPPLTNGG